MTGFKSHPCLDDVLNRAARFYMGVNKTCPLPCLCIEMGWLTNFRRRQLCLIRYYCCLQKMDDYRLPKRIYRNTKYNKNSWAADFKAVLDELFLGHYWETDSVIPLDIAKLMVREKCKEELESAVNERIKLRAYKTLIVRLQPAAHIKRSIVKNHRSLVGQLRCGILQLRIESGRYRGEKVEERICNYCDMNVVEDEFHFIFECPLYSDERVDMLLDLNVSSLKQLCTHPFVLGKYLNRICRKRSLHTIT